MSLKPNEKLETLLLEQVASIFEKGRKSQDLLRESLIVFERLRVFRTRLAKIQHSAAKDGEVAWAQLLFDLTEEFDEAFHFNRGADVAKAA